MEEPRWLAWVKELHALAQTGRHYAQNDFDRYEAVLRIAAEMAARQSDEEPGKVRDLFRHEMGDVTPKVDLRAMVMRGGGCCSCRNWRTRDAGRCRGDGRM